MLKFLPFVLALAVLGFSPAHAGPAGLGGHVDTAIHYDTATPLPYVANGAALTVGGTAFVAQHNVTNIVSGLTNTWALTKAPAFPVYRFELRNGDQWPSDDVTKERDELAESPGKETFGTEYWASYAFRYSSPTWTSTATSLRADAGQVHAGCVCIADFDLEVQPAGTLTFTYALDTTTDHTNTVQTDVWNSAYSVMNVWTNIVLHWKITADTTHGLLEMWANGVKVVDLPDVQVGFVNDPTGAYFKFGAYRSNRVDTVVAEYANMRYGTTDLSAYILAPEGVPAGGP